MGGTERIKDWLATKEKGGMTAKCSNVWRFDWRRVFDEGVIGSLTVLGC